MSETQGGNDDLAAILKKLAESASKKGEAKRPKVRPGVFSPKNIAATWGKSLGLGDEGAKKLEEILKEYIG